MGAKEKGGQGERVGALDERRHSLMLTLHCRCFRCGGQGKRKCRRVVGGAAYNDAEAASQVSQGTEPKTLIPQTKKRLWHMRTDSHACVYVVLHECRPLLLWG